MTSASGGAAPVALITGVGGQDGTYLAELLVGLGWHVHGVTRPGGASRPFMKHLEGVKLHSLDLGESRVAASIVRTTAPDYVFHLAGISSVWKSWADPVLTTRVNGVSATSLLDACFQQQEKSGKRVMMINASSAEIFAGSGESPQTESTRISPTSPYGASKALSHNMVQVYRLRGMEASNAILYNHESPRRPLAFVTRKITAAVAAISQGKQEFLELGNTAVERDWGWAPDYVQALLSMALYGKGDDFVIATGKSHTVNDFVIAAFASVGIEDWQKYVRTDPAMMRPADSASMIGDASKAGQLLDWQPTKTFAEIVSAMVDNDLTEGAWA